MLTVLQLAKGFLPVRQSRSLHRFEAVGVPPHLSAMLVPGPMGIEMHYFRGSTPDSLFLDNILHELCHALCGPKSLKDESALMVVQWALMKRLNRHDYTVCRKVLSDTYTLGNLKRIDLGTQFLRSDSWSRNRQKAIAQGLILKNGHLSPNLQVPFPQWKRYTHSK